MQVRMAANFSELRNFLTGGIIEIQDLIMLFKKAIKSSLPWAGPDGGYYMISLTKVKKRYPTSEGEVYELVILPGKEKRKLKRQFYKEVISKYTIDNCRKTKISLRRHAKALVPDYVKHAYDKLPSWRTGETVLQFGFQRSNRTCKTIPFVEEDKDKYYKLLKASSSIDHHDEMICTDWRGHKLVIHEMNRTPAYPHPFTTHFYSNDDTSSLDSEQSFHLSRCPSKVQFPKIHSIYEDIKTKPRHKIVGETAKTQKDTKGPQTQKFGPSSDKTMPSDSESTLEVELGPKDDAKDHISSMSIVSDHFYDFEPVREVHELYDRVYDEMLEKLQVNFPSYQYSLSKVPSIKIKKVKLSPGTKEPLYCLTDPKVKFARESIQIEYCPEKGTERIPQLLLPIRHRYPLPLEDVPDTCYAIVLPHPFISSMRPESAQYEELLSSYDSKWFWIINFPVQTFIKYVRQEVEYIWHGLKEKSTFKWNCFWSPVRFRLRKDRDKLDGHVMKPRDSNIKAEISRFSYLELEDDWGNDFCERMFEGVYV